MDSKLKHVTVLATVLIALMVVSVVLIANYDTIKKRTGSTASVTVAGSESSAAEGTDTEQTDGPVQIGKSLTAWQSDEGFFDTEESSMAAKILAEMQTVTLKIVSVERDMRVQILDYRGEPMEGESFSVLLRKPGTNEYIEATDDDMDGIVYMESLEPGEYLVSLKPVDGLKVPDSEESVRVPENVEYVYIEDIELYLKDDTELSAGLDDLMIVSAEGDADKKQSTKIGTDDTHAYGIEISSANGEVDWQKVYDSGIRFVMLRAGYRGAVTGDLIVDTSFKENARNAFRAGLDVGAYFESQAITEREAVEEASALAYLCEELHINYPLTIRIDQAGGNGRADSLDTDTRTGIAETFCQTIKNIGYTPCVYASKNWLNANLNSKRMEKYNVWLAELRSVPTYEGYYEIWEYSTKGKIDGVTGDAALNISYITTTE